jgi:hypothetical protein
MGLRALILLWRNKRMVSSKKYTVMFSDSFPAFAAGPDAPDDSNQAASKEEAVAMFKKWLKDTNNDYRRSVGYDQPVAWVHNTESWDGISYGDCDGYFLQREDGGTIVEGNY